MHVYNIKMVSKLVGIPTVTIRAWEKRYEVVVPQRTQSGHRLYSDQDIEDLLWLKKHIDEHGITISQAIKRLRQTRETLDKKVTITVEQSAFQSYAEQIYESLVNFRSDQANHLIDLVFSMFHYEDVFHKILTPILQKVGDDWENGMVTVTQEHFITNLIVNRFYQFFRIHPMNPMLPRVLAFCPAGEQHYVGLLLFTLFLRQHGVDVIFLGADTPTETLLPVIREKQIGVIVMSVSDQNLMEPVYEWIRKHKYEIYHIEIIVGGIPKVSIPEDLALRWMSGDLKEWKMWFETYIRPI
jgi:DNA-binding transcriptional MerR regulator/methylmalonyl-CoA mutase cobalamin-binding subunit